MLASSKCATGRLQFHLGVPCCSPGPRGESRQLVLILPVSGEFGKGKQCFLTPLFKSSWGSILLGCALDLQCREEEEGRTHASSPA